ncbi:MULTISPECIES: hypothetical protein [Halocynthiibacter]|uniref:Uncharacterized protein n=1 Tax=Halocynthiibacter halioticoli TaxID=2986804 RepID=A0AAE3LUT7_9RHOB|nr:MULTISPECIES: hypothetical protein [Halocynthiibacter]MCV6825765.1 hypothetical protein [Halocynthiibacter halioticoli]MCW4058766.1 hypothetical protein [Halocynthiibacter sp. SDUM655004]MDE0591139.1 hypothetical protein [Halocynthiibacter sp. C4]
MTDPVGETFLSQSIECAALQSYLLGKARMGLCRHIGQLLERVLREGDIE